MWWVAFFVAISSSIVAWMIGFLANALLGFALAAFGADPDVPLFGAVDTYIWTGMGLVFLGIATWHQAGFTRKRYVIVNPKQAALYSLGFFTAIGIVFYVLDWHDGYVWDMLSYVVEALTLVLFYLVARKRLGAG